jgi:hypothetical protein
LTHYINALSPSPFRNQFKLNARDLAYFKTKGIAITLDHGKDFIAKRLAPASIPNDGKQTPMRGHPIFVAQPATATCCRGCLQQWHQIPQDKALNAEEQAYVLTLLAHWLSLYE